MLAAHHPATINQKPVSAIAPPCAKTWVTYLPRAVCISLRAAPRHSSFKTDLSFLVNKYYIHTHSSTIIICHIPRRHTIIRWLIWHHTRCNIRIFIDSPAWFRHLHVQAWRWIACHQQSRVSSCCLLLYKSQGGLRPAPCSVCDDWWLTMRWLNLLPIAYNSFFPIASELGIILHYLKA